MQCCKWQLQNIQEHLIGICNQVLGPKDDRLATYETYLQQISLISEISADSVYQDKTSWLCTE